MTQIFPALVSALFLTIIIEYGVLLILFRKKKFLLLLYSILINGATNPLLNYVYLFHYPNLWLLEGLASIGETILIRYLMETSWKFALYCSVCANSASVLMAFYLM